MYRERKVWVAYMTALPWGVLGMHKFYLRQPILGCLYFCTAGLFVVGWMYDLATLPDQVDRCNERMDRRNDFQDFLEDEIEDLEDEIQHLRDEIAHLRSGQDVDALKQRVQDLEAQLRTHNEP